MIYLPSEFAAGNSLRDASDTAMSGHDFQEAEPRNTRVATTLLRARLAVVVVDAGQRVCATG
jgi:hypothetical protein